MNNKIYALKWYILDPSSYDIKDVEIYIFSSLEKAEMGLKKLAYQLYIDNEGDEVSIEDWTLEIYDSYEYEIVECKVD
jgi:hypothetical protein